MFRVWAQLCAGPVLTCRRLSAPVGAAWTGWGRKAWGHPTGLCSATQHPPPPPSELEPALLMVDSVWMLGAGLLQKFLSVLYTGVHVRRFPHALSPAWPLWLWAVPVSALPRSMNALGTGYTVSLAIGYPGAARPSSGSLAVLPPCRLLLGPGRLLPACPDSTPGQVVSAESTAVFLLPTQPPVGPTHLLHIRATRGTFKTCCVAEESSGDSGQDGQPAAWRRATRFWNVRPPERAPSADPSLLTPLPP